MSLDMCMIKFITEKEIKERHRVQCPYCKEIIDLQSIIEIIQSPGGLSLAVKLFTSAMKTPEKGLNATYNVQFTKTKPEEVNMIER